MDINTFNKLFETQAPAVLEALCFRLEEIHNDNELEEAFDKLFDMDSVNIHRCLAVALFGTLLRKNKIIAELESALKEKED